MDKKQVPVIKPGVSFMGRPDVQTLFIDKFFLMRRTDGMILIRGIQEVPGLEIEGMRFIITENHARSFLDTLAKLIDYYPERAPVKPASVEKK